MKILFKHINLFILQNSFFEMNGNYALLREEDYVGVARVPEETFKDLIERMGEQGIVTYRCEPVSLEKAEEIRENMDRRLGIVK